MAWTARSTRTRIGYGGAHDGVTTATAYRRVTQLVET